MDECRLGDATVVREDIDESKDPRAVNQAPRHEAPTHGRRGLHVGEHAPRTSRTRGERTSLDPTALITEKHTFGTGIHARLGL